LLSVVLLRALAMAGTAPQFSLRTLDGQSFTNSSLEGNVVLLQFWTTWCPVCRGDQPAVDNVQAEFGSEGLVVIAVDDGEPEAVVRRYLQDNPRSVAIAVDPSRSLSARFGVHGYPHYVVIDRNGNMTASRGGGGGEEYLRDLLRTAGMPSRSGGVQEASGASAPAPSSRPQLVNVPPAVNPTIAKPIPKTIFVFTDGARLEADHYELNTKFLNVTAEGQQRSIPLSALDVQKTVAANRERGIDLKIPSNGNEIFLAF
jgi:thiol-disulfide isomerase/thioredoxin